MNNVVKNIILGTQSVTAFDEIFGSEYNVQNERYKKVLMIFINKVKKEIAYGRLKPEEVDLKVNELMRVISNPASVANQFILGANVQDSSMDMEIDTLLGIYHKTELDDVEDMFSVDKEQAIGLNDFQIEEYFHFPELLNRDLEYGVITPEQAKLIKEKIEKDMASGMSSSKVLAKVKPGFSNREIDLGFIEPVLLSMVVSSIGLLYVAYLYLVV